MTKAQANTINTDTASRLIGVSPAELTALANGGTVRRVDKNAFLLPALVADYISHLKAEHERGQMAPTQLEIAAHLDLSDRSVREFMSKTGMDNRTCTIDEFRVAYIRNLREQAAGRATEGDLNLAGERAGLAREQKDRIAMMNAQTRRELAPVVSMTLALAKVGQQIAGILDALPGVCRRRLNLSVEQIEVIQGEVTKARNAAASIRLDVDGEVEDAEREIEAV